MTNANTSPATSTANSGRSHRTCTTIAAILLGATALAASSLPASASSIDVNAKIQNYLNSHAAKKNHVTMFKGIPGASYSITSVRVERLGAKPVKINRPSGPYKVIATKAVVMCPDEVHGNPDSSVMQQIEFINTVSNKISATTSDTTMVGQEATVKVGVTFGTGVKKSVELGFAVKHEKTNHSSDTTSDTTVKTIRERAQVRLNGVGGKWAVLWARQHKVTDIPYTASFTPRPTDMVTFKLKHAGQVCVSEHGNHQGQGHCFDPGQDVNRLRDFRFNDRISSFNTAGMFVTFFKNDHFTGTQVRVAGRYPNLRGWTNDSFSSLRVEGVPEIRVPFSRVKQALPANLHKFDVKGRISVDMTQATQTKFVSVPMSKAEFEHSCNLSGGVGDFAMMKKMKKTKKGSGNVLVRDVLPAKLATMNFKAPLK